MCENVNDLKGKKFKDMEGDLFNKGQWYRLKKWQDVKSVKGVDRNVAFALSEIDRLVGKLGAGDEVKVEAVRVYNGACEHGVLSGRSIEVVIASSVYVGCRLCHAPFSVAEVALVCGVTGKQVVSVYKIIVKELGLRLPLVHPKDFVVRFCSVLGLSDVVRDRSFKMIEEAESVNLVGGKSPTVVVASVLYLSGVLMGEKRTQRDIAEVAGVSDVAIRKYCRLLKGELGLPL